MASIRMGAQIGDRQEEGGSRTVPGKFGARALGILRSLQTKDCHKDVALSADQMRRLTLWPAVDISPLNPTGVESLRPQSARGP